MGAKARTTQLIQNYYQAFNRKDWRGMLALLSDDVVHDLNQGLRQAGKAAFSGFLETMAAHYDETLSDFVVMVSDDGERAAAEFVCQGRYMITQGGLPSAKGQTYRLPVGAFFEIKGQGDAAKIARVTNYYNLEDWLKQVK